MSLDAEYQEIWEEQPAVERQAPALAPVPPQGAPHPRPLLYACNECVHGLRMGHNRNFRCRKTGHAMAEQVFVPPPGCPGFEPRVAG
jgi:hypothetical protein